METTNEQQTFFKHFLSNVNPEDQLPVRVDSCNLTRVEVIGAVINWILQYLHSWKCPNSLVTPLTKIILDEVRSTLDVNKCQHYNKVNGVYSSLPLMQHVVSVIRDVCRKYSDGNVLTPVPVSDYIYTSTFASKNGRKRMEDCHVIINDLQIIFDVKDCGPVNYYAIFDGHNGIGAAMYSSTHLHQFLAESQYYPMYPTKALCEAFRTTDKHLMEKGDSPLARSGTTAVCVLWHRTEKMLYVAWVGDSEAILVRKRCILRLVEPHKANREDEKERIHHQGGVVLFYCMTWRVNGQVAVTRAIGDSEHKPYIISEPDVKSIQLEGDEDFLILACDGLWDTVTPQDAALTVYKHILSSPGVTRNIEAEDHSMLINEMNANGSDDDNNGSILATSAADSEKTVNFEVLKENYDEVSHLLVELAKKEGSEDNITVIVVYLSDPRHIKPPSVVEMETATAESFSPKQNGSTYCSINNLQNNFDPEDDFGPETNIDNIDDGLPSQPVSTKKTFTNFENLKNNGFNDELRNSSTVTGTKDSEIDTTDDNDAVSDDSDDEEWNYFGGQGTNNSKSNNCQNMQPSENSMSAVETDYSLNPDAAEFVPVSPTSVKSTDGTESSSTFTHLAPEVRERLLNDDFVASSPLKGHEKSMENVEVPTLNDFDKEIRKRPSNIMPDFNADDSFETDGDVCPIKNETSEEAETVTNDTCVSTKAVFGDESTYAKNLEEVNEDLQEKSEYVHEYCHTETDHVSDVYSQVMENGVFDSEEYPSIIEKENTEPNADGSVGSASFDHCTTNKDQLDVDSLWNRENKETKVEDDIFSVIEDKENDSVGSASFDHCTTNKDKLNIECLSNCENKETKFEDISSIVEDNQTESVLRNVISFTEEVQPTHTTILMDGQSTFTANSNTSSPVADLLNGKCYQNSNPFAATDETKKENVEEKETDVHGGEELDEQHVSTQSRQNDFINFINEKEVQGDMHSTHMFFEFDRQEENENVSADRSYENEFEIQNQNSDNVAEEPICMREVKTEVEISPEKNVELEKNTQPAFAEEDMLSPQTVDYADVCSEEDTNPQDTNITSSSSIENIERVATQYDAEAHYRHDCTQISEKPDSVHHEPVEMKHYDDLLPGDESDTEETTAKLDVETSPYAHDYEEIDEKSVEKPDSVNHEPMEMNHYDNMLPNFETSTMESDKLESELRETEMKTSESDVNQFCYTKSTSSVNTSETEKPVIDFINTEDSGAVSLAPFLDDTSKNVEIREVSSDDQVEMKTAVTKASPTADLLKNESIVEITEATISDAEPATSDAEPAISDAEPAISDIEPATNLLEAAVPLVGAAVVASTVAAVVTETLDAKKEVKRSVIKKPEEKEKPKLPANKSNTKPATSMVAKTRLSTTSTSPKVPAEPRKLSTTTATASRTAPVKSSLSTARPAASKSTPTVTKCTTVQARSIPSASKTAASVAPAKPAAAKLNSPTKAKPSPTTTKMASKSLTNGDVSKSLTTAKKTAPSMTAVKKSPVTVNLSTRTSLAPKPRPTLTKPESPADNKPKVSSTLTAKRPISAPSKTNNKDSKDLTNKRLSASKTSPLKSVTTNGKTESKVNSGLRSTATKTVASSLVSSVKKSTTPTNVNVNGCEVTVQHQN